MQDVGEGYEMNRQTVLGLWIIGGFVLVMIGEAVAIIVLAYKVGIYKGKLARYEFAEKQPSAAETRR